MPEGRFGLPRPFAESKPLVRVIVDKEKVDHYDELSDPQDNILYYIYENYGYERSESINIASSKDQGYHEKDGMIHYGFDVQYMGLSELADLHEAIDREFDDYESIIEVT